MIRSRKFLSVVLALAMTVNVSAWPAPQATPEPPRGKTEAPAGNDAKAEPTIRVRLDGQTADIRITSRPQPVITAVTDVDLPPQIQLAAIHRDRRLMGGKTAPTPERQALEAKWGAAAFASAWLRIDGDNLPLEQSEPATISFEDDKIAWTGQRRASAKSAKSLEIQVLLKKGIASGIKELELNGAGGTWAYGLEPIAVRHVRALRSGDELLEPGPGQPAAGAPEAEVESVNDLYVGEAFQVEVEFQSEPPFAKHTYASRVGEGEAAVYEVRKVPGHPKRFRSGLLLLDAQENPTSALPDTFAGRVMAPAKGGATLISLGIETAVPSQGRTMARARVIGRPPSLWLSAWKRAMACRASGKSPLEISHRIIMEGFRKRTLKISAEDHASAILLRDELALGLERYARNEHGAVATGGETARRLHAAYTASIIAQVRGVTNRTHITQVEVDAPPNLQPPSPGDIIPLHAALTDRMEARTFNGDRAKFFEYAQTAVASARRKLADNAQITAINIRYVGDCDLERIFPIVHMGLDPIIASLQRKLMRPPLFSEPSIPRLVPDGQARRHVANLGTLIDAVVAQSEYNSADTNFVVNMAMGVVLGVGVARLGANAAMALELELPTGVVGRVLGKEVIAKSTAASLAPAAWWVGKGASAIDLGYLANDYAAYSSALDDVKFAEQILVVAGDSRMQAALANADNKLDSLLLNAFISGAANSAGAVLGRRRTQTASAAPASATPPPSPGAAPPPAPASPAPSPTKATPALGRQAQVLRQPGLSRQGSATAGNPAPTVDHVGGTRGSPAGSGTSLRAGPTPPVPTGPPETIDEVLAQLQALNPSGPGTRNCHFCAEGVEDILRGGSPAPAPARPATSIERGRNHGQAVANNPPELPRTRDWIPAESVDQIESLMTALPPGSHAQVQGLWKRKWNSRLQQWERNGHEFNVWKDKNGNVHFIDGQTATTIDPRDLGFEDVRVLLTNGDGFANRRAASASPGPSGSGARATTTRPPASSGRTDAPRTIDNIGAVPAPNPAAQASPAQPQTTPPSAESPAPTPAAQTPPMKARAATTSTASSPPLGQSTQGLSPQDASVLQTASQHGVLSVQGSDDLVKGLRSSNRSHVEGARFVLRDSAAEMANGKQFSKFEDMMAGFESGQTSKPIAKQGVDAIRRGEVGPQGRTGGTAVQYKSYKDINDVVEAVREQGVKDFSRYWNNDARRVGDLVDGDGNPLNGIFEYRFDAPKLRANGYTDTEIDRAIKRLQQDFDVNQNRWDPRLRFRVVKGN